MKRTILGLLIAGTVLVAASCASQSPATTTDNTTANTPTTTGSPETTRPATATDPGDISAQTMSAGAFVSDAAFAAKAIESGMAEVKLGNLAGRKAVNPEVKQFSLQMVQDHTRANSLLMRLSQQKKWVTPDNMDAEHQQIFGKLNALMNNEFDQLYMAQMVKDHEMAVALYQQAANKASDPELKAFASNTLPALRKHLGMARDLNQRVGGIR